MSYTASNKRRAIIILLFSVWTVIILILQITGKASSVWRNRKALEKPIKASNEETVVNLHAILDIYMDKFSQLILKNNANWHARDGDDNNLNKYEYKRISKQFIIDTMSNKRILFFGDSQNYYLAAYIIHVLYLCIEKAYIVFDNDTLCPSFCTHLNLNQPSMVLTPCVISMLNQRKVFVQILSNINNTESVLLYNNFGVGVKNSTIVFEKYNLTISLYYMWSQLYSHAHSVQDMLTDLELFTINNNYSYDIIINNLLITHLIFKDLPKCGSNCNFGLSVQHNLEYILEAMIKTKNDDQCYLFGPVNPRYSGSAESLCRGFCALQKQLLDFLNISTQMIANKRDIASPYIGSAWLANMKYMNEQVLLSQNSKLLNKIKEISMDDIESKTLPLYKIDKCIRNIRDNLKIIGENRNVSLKYAAFSCIMYQEELQWNLYSNRIQHFIQHMVPNKKIYYLNQYKLYWTIARHNISQFGDTTHLQGLIPVAWTNILNKIDKGC